MLELLIPVLSTAGAVLGSSIAVYFAIRYLAYKRSLRIPHQFDFFWVVLTLLSLFVLTVELTPLEKSINHRFLIWTTFLTFLVASYEAIFLVDQFIVEYFLVSVLKVKVSPPLRKTIMIFLFLLAVLIGMQKIFSINPWAVYAPTSLVSLGIGIALKDAFKMFFAGVALSRYVNIGDWIKLGDKEGQVMEINWARTVLRTWEGHYLFIPNSELQDQAYVNYHYKNTPNRFRIDVGVSYDAPPIKVKEVLLSCVRNVDGIVSGPPPEVLVERYDDSSILYALVFWVDEYSRWRQITSEVSTRIWYAFKREGLVIPFPIRTVHLERKHREDTLSAELDLEALVFGIDLFKMLQPEDRGRLAPRLKKQAFLKGEVIVGEGEPGSSLFVLLSGKLEVVRGGRGGEQTPIGVLLAGQFFGELSLLTGEPRSATVRALADSELVRLEKNDFQEIMTLHPNLADRLAEVVSSRRAELAEYDSKQKEISTSVQENRSNLSLKIRRFFNLGA